MLGGQLDWRERILDLVRDLPRHLGPGFEPMSAFELDALCFELGRHAVERIGEPAELVSRSDSDMGLEVAPGDPAGRSRKAADRIGDSLCHGQPDTRAEQDEEQRRKVDAAIEVVDLAADFTLPQRQRHRQQRVLSCGAHRRGCQNVSEGAEHVLAHEAGQPLQHDGMVDVVRRSRRQDARREQIALAMSRPDARRRRR